MLLYGNQFQGKGRIKALTVVTVCYQTSDFYTLSDEQSLLLYKDNCL